MWKINSKGKQWHLCVCTPVVFMYSCIIVVSAVWKQYQSKHNKTELTFRVDWVLEL